MGLERLHNLLSALLIQGSCWLIQQPDFGLGQKYPAQLSDVPLQEQLIVELYSR